MPTGVEFAFDVLITAIQRYPFPLLFPSVFAAIWVLWVLIAGNHLLLKKGLKGLLGLLVGSLLVLIVLLLFSLGAIGGGTIGKGMEFFALLLIMALALLYVGIIPFLITISWKSIMGGPFNNGHGPPSGS